MVADTYTQSDVTKLVESALERFGSLDGLVLNAGVVRAGSAGELTDQAWDDMVSTNLTGPFRLARKALPHLLASRELSSVSRRRRRCGPHVELPATVQARRG